MANLATNMRSCITAVQQTRAAIPLSVNYNETSSNITRADGSSLHYDGSGALADVRDVIGPLIRDAHHGFFQNGNNLKTVREVAGRILQGDVGNCLEQGFVTALKLYDAGARGVDIVKVTVPAGFLAAANSSVIPHVFTVLGRSGSNRRGGNIGLPNTWGDNAVVADSWDRVVYPAKQYQTFWGGLRDATNGHAAQLRCELMFRI